MLSNKLKEKKNKSGKEKETKRAEGPEEPITDERQTPVPAVL